MTFHYCTWSITMELVHISESFYNSKSFFFMVKLKCMLFLCSVWQHIECMGISSDAVPDNYLCDQCQPRWVGVKGPPKNVLRLVYDTPKHWAKHVDLILVSMVWSNWWYDLPNPCSAGCMSSTCQRKHFNNKARSLFNLEMWSLAAQKPYIYFDLGVCHCVKSSSVFLVRENIVVYQEKPLRKMRWPK